MANAYKTTQEELEAKFNELERYIFTTAQVRQVKDAKVFRINPRLTRNQVEKLNRINVQEAISTKMRILIEGITVIEILLKYWDADLRYLEPFSRWSNTDKIELIKYLDVIKDLFLHTPE